MKEKEALAFKKKIEEIEGFYEIKSKVNNEWEIKKENHN